MKIGQKVKIVGRFDMRQKPDAIKIPGEIFKLTEKRIYVVEPCYTIFVFDKKTKKAIGGNWVLKIS